MRSIYERIRPGMTRNQWKRARRRLRLLRIDYHVRLPDYISVQEVIENAKRLREGAQIMMGESLFADKYEAKWCRVCGTEYPPSEEEIECCGECGAIFTDTYALELKPDNADSSDKFNLKHQIEREGLDREYEPDIADKNVKGDSQQ